MKARGQGLLALAVAGVVALGAISLDRLGPQEPAAPRAGTATSGTWLCPHGGGKAYEATVYLANPGETDVDARVTELGSKGPAASSRVVVPAGAQIPVSVDASDRASSTFVETFGGWVAAGWVVRGAEGEVGIGAEPCAASAGRAWVSAAATTDEGEDTFLVVMNPFDTDAVFDVALFTTDRAPVRDSKLTDVTLRSRRSTAIRLNDFAQGEAALGLSIELSSGRLAASTLMVSESRGIAGVLADQEPADRHLLLTSSGVGRSVLSVVIPTVPPAAGEATTPSPGQLGSTFTATLRSKDQPVPAGGITEQSQEAGSAVVYPVATVSSSAVDLAVGDGAAVAAALRTIGVGNDGGATTGSTAPASSWVVTPTVVGQPARPGLLVLNPGRSRATVEITSLPSDGEGAAETTSISVPPGRVAGVPREFLDGIGVASLVLVSDGEPVVALGASTSLGNEGLSVFGLAAGVPIPDAETP
ncbi:MAG: DUF5719 family protein [Actinomycetota bacterium]|nr:DUF5719 family protein [Actinomycetota bacterium]MDH5225179.1 DUF5719 family protein [Actinomycetota bacterium]